VPGIQAQNLNMNADIAYSLFRAASLKKTDNSHTLPSFCLRPNTYPMLNQYLHIDSSIISQKVMQDLTYFSFFNKKGHLAILPLMVNHQYNPQRPFGWNDGSMVPARGYEIQASAGFFLQLGSLHIQINPELVWAENRSFKILQNPLLNPTVATNYHYYVGSIDNPEMISTGKPYSQLLPGQSSVSLNVKKISVGISTENIWWGPGIRNSLIMSNNAPGFSHLTLNTTAPVNIGIGYMEGQIISGITESSRDNTATIGQGYVNGIILSYNPKWIKELFIGLIRAYNQFYADAKKNHDYFPVLSNLFRKNDGMGSRSDDQLNRDQLASVFFRYVLKKSKTEIYAEYGRNDASYNLRDLLQSPEHTRAFIFGGQKLFPVTHGKEFILVQTELTQIQQPGSYRVRPSSPSWYVHGQVTRGYTNKGKILGAGIGPGSNCRNIAVKWIRPNSIIGINLMQIDRNNDLYYELFTNPAINRKWTDNVIGLNGNFLYGKDKKIMINWNVDYIRTKNYHWLLDQYSPDDPANVKQYRNNWHIKIATIYKF